MSKKLRIFAGPNGSGKTSLFERIREHYHFNIGIYVNPDLIQSQLKEHSSLSLSDFSIESGPEEITRFFETSTLALKTGMKFQEIFEMESNQLFLKQVGVGSYLSAILSEFIRQKLLSTEQTFSTETVMSDPSKIELIKNARINGFKVYLYYITTDDVRINIERVKSRVLGGGHPVPEEKIPKRYVRSLNLLFDAAKYCDRVFLVDSTELPIRLIAEIMEGAVTIKQVPLPNWYINYFEDRIITA